MITYAIHYTLPTTHSSFPDSDDAVAADVGVDLGWVELLEVADNQIVSKLLVASGLRMLMEGLAEGWIIGHSLRICSVKKSPRASKFLKLS